MQKQRNNNNIKNRITLIIIITATTKRALEYVHPTIMSSPAFDGSIHIDLGLSRLSFLSPVCECIATRQPTYLPGSHLDPCSKSTVQWYMGRGHVRQTSPGSAYAHIHFPSTPPTRLNTLVAILTAELRVLLHAVVGRYRSPQHGISRLTTNLTYLRYLQNVATWLDVTSLRRVGQGVVTAVVVTGAAVVVAADVPSTASKTTVRVVGILSML